MYTVSTKRSILTMVYNYLTIHPLLEYSLLTSAIFIGNHASSLNSIQRNKPAVANPKIYGDVSQIAQPIASIALNCRRDRLNFEFCVLEIGSS